MMDISIHALLAESDERADRLTNAPPHISIHALLAESDTHPIGILVRVVISIHALLAESDVNGVRLIKHIGNFYPRSPCGERPKTNIKSPHLTSYFYPRSPCGERLHGIKATKIFLAFLSTLSLRRATQSILSDYQL